MFWGIDRNEWLVLWSGVLGASISASVAATIAVLVLVRSNRHQQELVERQLVEHRREASISREKTAVADVVETANGFLAAAESGLDDIQSQTLAFRSASFRWQMEIDDLNLVLDLIQWANVLGDAAQGRYLAERVPEQKEEFNEWSGVLTESISTVFAFGLTWYRLPSERMAAIKNFKASRAAMEQRIKAISLRTE